MAKFEKKIKAQELRRQGQSIKDIAKKLEVSKSSASIWCRDIQLTKEQIVRLDKKQKIGAYRGRLKGAQVQRKRHLKRIETIEKKAIEEIGRLSKRDLFIAGIGLYWGEGSKTGCMVRFHNSNPQIICFMMVWFRKIFKIPENEFTMYVCINEIHRNRLNEVNKYWSKITKIPLKQFRKPILAKTTNKKVYTNLSRHFGTLSIRINKSSNLFHKIQGYNKALGLVNKF